MKILITGGAGYLGTMLGEYYSNKGYQIYSIDLKKNTNSNIHSHIVDLCNSEQVNNILSSVKPEIVIHAAAKLDRTQNFKSFDEFIQTNLLATNNVLSAVNLIPNVKRFAYISTSEVYGLNIMENLSENMKVTPKSPYGISKYFAEKLIESRINSNKEYQILRLFNFFGKGMPQGFYISDLISSLALNKTFNMTLGNQYRDFLLIDEAVAYIDSILFSNITNQTINICSGSGTQIKAIAQILSQYFNKENLISLGSIATRTNEIQRMIGDNTKLLEMSRLIIKEPFPSRLIKYIIDNQLL